MAFVATSRIRTEDPVVGATVWVVAEVPDGPYVSVFRLAADDRAVLSANGRHATDFCVPTGTGWVYGPGVDRCAVRAGGHVSIYRGDAVTLEADSALDVVVVSADWMIPEGAATPSASFRQLTPRVYAHPKFAQITVAPVAEVPDGTSVKVLTFPAGAVLDLSDASWNAVYDIGIHDDPTVETRRADSAPACGNAPVVVRTTPRWRTPGRGQHSSFG
jgi:hypothetical protein